MTRRVVEKLCTKKVCVDFLAPKFRPFEPEIPKKVEKRFQKRLEKG